MGSVLVSGFASGVALRLRHANDHAFALGVIAGRVQRAASDRNRCRHGQPVGYHVPDDSPKSP